MIHGEMNVKPTPYYQKNKKYYPTYVNRIRQKKWNEIWGNLSIEK